MGERQCAIVIKIQFTWGPGRHQGVRTGAEDTALALQIEKVAQDRIVIVVLGIVQDAYIEGALGGIEGAGGHQCSRAVNAGPKPIDERIIIQLLEIFERGKRATEGVGGRRRVSEVLEILIIHGLFSYLTIVHSSFGD